MHLEFTPVNIALISLSCIFILLSALFFGFFFLINFKNKKNLKKIRELIERFNVLSNNKIAKNLRWLIPLINSTNKLEPLSHFFVSYRDHYAAEIKKLETDINESLNDLNNYTFSLISGSNSFTDRKIIQIEKNIKKIEEMKQTYNNLFIKITKFNIATNYIDSKFIKVSSKFNTILELPSLKIPYNLNSDASIHKQMQLAISANNIKINSVKEKSSFDKFEKLSKLQIIKINNAYNQIHGLVIGNLIISDAIKDQHTLLQRIKVSKERLSSFEIEEIKTIMKKSRYTITDLKNKMISNSSFSRNEGGFLNLYNSHKNIVNEINYIIDSSEYLYSKIDNISKNINHFILSFNDIKEKYKSISVYFTKVPDILKYVKINTKKIDTLVNNIKICQSKIIENQSKPQQNIENLLLILNGILEFNDLNKDLSTRISDFILEFSNLTFLFQSIKNKFFLMNKFCKEYDIDISTLVSTINSYERKMNRIETQLFADVSENLSKINDISKYISDLEYFVEKFHDYIKSNIELSALLHWTKLYANRFFDDTNVKVLKEIEKNSLLNKEKAIYEYIDFIKKSNKIRKS